MDLECSYSVLLGTTLGYSGLLGHVIGATPGYPGPLSYSGNLGAARGCPELLGVTRGYSGLLGSYSGRLEATQGLPGATRGYSGLLNRDYL